MINEIMRTLWRECALLIKQNKRKEACGVYAAAVRLVIMHSASLSDERLRGMFLVLEILPEASKYAEPIIDMATPQEKQRFAIFQATQQAISRASGKPEHTTSPPPLFK